MKYQLTRSLPQRRLVTRYVLLYCLFGVVVGVHLSAGCWVIKVFGIKGGGHLLMAFTMAGMLLGEISGARLTDYYSRSRAVLFAAKAFGVAALTSFIAVMLWTPESHRLLSSFILTAGAFAFGLGLGTQHSSVDAWFKAITKFNSRRNPTDAEFGWGYSSYTFGFFVGQVLFFPLLYNFDWQRPIAMVGEKVYESTPIVMPISSLPYLLSLAACALIFLFKPYPCEDQQTELTTSRRSLSEMVRHGGVALLTMLVVGSCVSFVVFHIDTFAGPDLLEGLELGQKTIGLGIVCLLTFAMVAVFSWTLETNERFRTLSPAARSTLLGLNLFACVVLFGVIMLMKGSGHSTWLRVAILLGFGSGLVNTLPQLVKWAVLECASIHDQGKVSALLGVSKRIPNLMFSVAVVLFSTVELDSANFTYKLLIGANVIALIALLVYYSRVRRFVLTLVPLR